MAILSIIFYAVNIWAAVEISKKNMKLLTKTIRPLKQRMCMAYRTASNSALDIISGIPPTKHLINERLRIWRKEESKSDIKASIRAAWIAEWEQNTNKDTWIKSLLIDPDYWLTREFGNPDFFLTQALTGHGAFNSYLHRFRISPSPFCPFCPAAPDTPEHALFQCSKFTPERARLEKQTGEIFNIANFQICLQSSQENWTKVCLYIKYVLESRKREIDQLIFADVCRKADSGVALKD